MDIGANGIVAWIASSTTSSLSTYSPVFYLVIGVILAFVVISFLIALLTRSGPGDIDSHGLDFDDTIEI
jgi:hypothetical protein